MFAGLLALQLFGGGSITAPDDPQDMTPVVLGIYPNESFGIQQSNGLKASLEGFPQLMVQDLDAPLDAMKTRNAPGQTKLQPGAVIDIGWAHDDCRALDAT